MPVLTNNRRELFANLLARGFTAVDAYQKAGFKRHDGNASTLSRNPEIEDRLAEIRADMGSLLSGRNRLPVRNKCHRRPAPMLPPRASSKTHRRYSGALIIATSSALVCQP
jgi:hypothetical protein